MDKRLIFNPPNGLYEKEFFLDLSGRYRIRRNPPRDEKYIYYDTFDWRLFHKNVALINSTSKIFLRYLNSYSLLYSVDVDSPPVFFWDLPESRLRDYLSSILEMRALLKLFEVDIHLTAVDLLDHREKTFARVHYEAIKLLKEKDRISLGTQLSVFAVKGYEEQCLGFCDWLSQKKFAKTCHDIYDQALGLLRKKPGGYSNKPNVQLSRTMRADTATKMILRTLLDVMKKNQVGIKKDIDSEFLHDFRVAIRRTRSILSQIKSVFPDDVTDYFKKGFSDLGKLTNYLRDLDVYLLQQEEYREKLPDFFKADIKPLFGYLARERRKQLKKVVQGLNSEKHLKVLKDWEAFLNEFPAADSLAENADKPIVNIACERIYKKYRTVIKLGRRILKESQESMLHRLRIECKKLRYLMEFFCEFIPPRSHENVSDATKEAPRQFRAVSRFLCTRRGATGICC